MTEETPGKGIADRRDMKNRFRVISLIMCAAVLLGACESSASEEKGASGESRIYETEDGTYYTFQDVEGNSYDAPLLDNVPRCSYNLDYLKTDEETKNDG